MPRAKPQDCFFHRVSGTCVGSPGTRSYVDTQKISAAGGLSQGIYVILKIAVGGSPIWTWRLNIRAARVLSEKHKP